MYWTGQSKPSVSSLGDDSFVTPQRSRKSKKPVITFSSDEEEDEEGKCSHCAVLVLCIEFSSVRLFEPVD